MGGWAIAVHGGAGVDPNLPLERQEEAKQLLTRVLNLGISALRSNLSAIDVVELVVYVLFYLVPTPIMSCPVPLFLPLLFLNNNNNNNDRNICDSYNCFSFLINQPHTHKANYSIFHKT
jgi:hypothetical protein